MQTDSFLPLNDLHQVNLIVLASTGDGSPAVEVAFDGTVYDLETGKVRCPPKTRMQSGHSVVGDFCGKIEPRNVQDFADC